MTDKGKIAMFETPPEWSTNPSTASVDSGLIKRLRETWCGRSGMSERHLVNPDGPEAADEIERLTALATDPAAVDEPTEALRRIAAEELNSPPGDAMTRRDMILLARKAMRAAHTKQEEPK